MKLTNQRNVIPFVLFSLLMPENSSLNLAQTYYLSPSYRSSNRGLQQAEIVQTKHLNSMAITRLITFFAVYAPPHQPPRSNYRILSPTLRKQLYVVVIVRSCFRKSGRKVISLVSSYILVYLKFSNSFTLFHQLSLRFPFLFIAFFAFLDVIN